MANTWEATHFRLAIGVYRLCGGEMENDDLENRLKEATAEDSRQLIVEFVSAFCVDQPEVSVEEVTFEGHVTE